MTNYAQLTNSFEACRLDPAAFDHADHVGVAYEMLQRYSFIEATTRYLAGIQKLATAAGAAGRVAHHNLRRFDHRASERT